VLTYSQRGEKMNFVNRSKLRGKLAEHEVTREQLAEKLGIGCSALYNKMKGESEFTEKEIVILYKEFGMDIFFLDNLPTF
jgi:transcriptional regulator with XRE-family HTH domain